MDLAILRTRENISIMDIQVNYVSDIPPNGHVYQNKQGDEGVITYNPATGNVFGTFKTNLGKSFAIEKCIGGYIWKEFDIGSFSTDQAMEMRARRMYNPRVAELRAAALADNTTSASLSIMFYYTPQFAAITYDIPGFIDQVPVCSLSCPW